MSTEIKNTLFRFVTMRAPELNNENGLDKRFVFRKLNKSITDTDKIFDKSVAEKATTVSKWQAIANTPFEALSESQIKEISPSMVGFGIWISRNKHSFTYPELILEKEKVLAQSIAEGLLENGLSDTHLNLLWNNLFYQVVTQKNFYAKECIMQLLIANHVYQNVDYIQKLHNSLLSKKKAQQFSEIDLEEIKSILNARVVLPRELFVEEANVIKSNTEAKKENRNKFPFPILEELSQMIAFDTSKERLKSVELLKKELKKAERIYRKEYQNTYEKAYSEYEKSIQPILDKYKQEIEENKTRWCSTRDIRENYDPKDPCQQIPLIPQPNIPKFEFEFIEEGNLSFLKKHLSYESFMVLLEILNIQNREQSTNKIAEDSFPDDYDYPPGGGNSYGFDDIYDTIDQETTLLNNEVITNTPNNSLQHVLINGISVPLVSGNTLGDYEGQGCKEKVNNKTYFYYILGLPGGKDVNISASSLSINGVSIPFLKIGLLGTYVVLKSTTEILENGEVELNIVLTDGHLWTYWHNDVAVSFRGYLSHQTQDDSQNDSAEDNNSQEHPYTSTTQNGAFVPAGFGVKQLGIADYKKVEQTVQGYVEGEVALIENIMAREYKEKATRRLRRSENTTTSSTESEAEKLTDTTSTNRFEMQSEVANVIQEAKDSHAEAGITSKPFGDQLIITAGGGMANHSSKEESNRIAQTQAQEITQRAMERVVNKVKEERVVKIIEEFEESNKHGFDNTKGDKHVVGVFRWVDKIYKNRILNYGKRLMFEFMIPEPAKLHRLGMTENSNALDAVVLTKPIDPRKDTVANLADYSKVNETTTMYWGSFYNVALPIKPTATIFVGTSFEQSNKEADIPVTKTGTIKIPEGYVSSRGQVNFTGMSAIGGWDRKVIASIGNKSFISSPGRIEETNLTPIESFSGEIPVAVSTTSFHTSTVTLNVECTLTSQKIIEWKQETFKAIIDAYENALTEYNNRLAEEKAKGNAIKEANPEFYRQIEHMVLRKNCISYIINQQQNAYLTYGINMVKTPKDAQGNVLATSFGNYEIEIKKQLDDYALFVKFLEQAFEWNIMNYDFYPYYWGNRTNWAELYQHDSNDPLFRSFMQAGMARVVVTVRPGFEDAVRFYMQTGLIWNGGEVPVIDEPMYMSIVDELREPSGKPEGKAWWTRIPTTLTILQAQTIGLNVTKALPYNEEVSDFEDPTTVPHSQELALDPTLLGGSSTYKRARILGKIIGADGISVKIALKKFSGEIVAIDYKDNTNNYELNNLEAGSYELLLDADNYLSSTEYFIAEGAKAQTVELQNDQTLEVNLVVKKM